MKRLWLPGIAGAAIAALAALALLRRSTAPPESAAPMRARPVPAARASDTPSPAPAVRRGPAPRPAVGNQLVELAAALRNGEYDVAERLLAALRLEIAPPVPDDQNAAVPYGEAVELLGRLAKKDRKSDVYDMLSDLHGTPEKAQAAREWFRLNADVVARMQELCLAAAGRPHCRFPSDTDSMKFVRLQEVCQLLVVKGVLDHADGQDPGGGLDAAFAAGRGLRHDPRMYTQMIAAACDALGVDGLQRAWNPASPRLAGLIDGLEPGDTRHAYERMFAGEAMWAVEYYLGTRKDPSREQDEEMRAWVRGATAPHDVATYVEHLGEYLALGARPWSEMGSEIEALARRHTELSPHYATLSRSWTGMLPKVVEALSRSEARLSMVKVALEVERYRARFGAYPPALEVLGTDLLRDPTTGGAFTYRLDGTGFVLEGAGILTWRPR